MASESERHHRAPIDMSLRLWSDDVDLGAVLQRIGLEYNVSHVPGMPMKSEGPLARRIARRHYVSAARVRGHDGADVASWLNALLIKIRADDALLASMRNRRIEAVLWIALLGRKLMSTPRIAPVVVADVAAMGMAIFVENYTQLDNGNPSSLWLPAKPAAQMMSA